MLPPVSAGRLFWSTAAGQASWGMRTQSVGERGQAQEGCACIDSFNETFLTTLPLYTVLLYMRHALHTDMSLPQLPASLHISLFRAEVLTL